MKPSMLKAVRTIRRSQSTTETPMQASTSTTTTNSDEKAVDVLNEWIAAVTKGAGVYGDLGNSEETIQLDGLLGRDVR